MAADSGTYGPEVIARRYAMAQQLLGDRKQPITHWAQGLDELAKGALGGYQMNQTENLERQSRAEANAQIAAALGLPAPAPFKPERGGYEKIASLFGGSKSDAPTPETPIEPVQTAQPMGGLPDFAKAISSVESGGKYDALGPVTKTGDRAYGKYQVMGANIPQWTKTHLGQEMTPAQFVASPEAQDIVFNKQFGQYAQKHGPEGAAKAWFAGEGGMNNPNAKDILGTTVDGYANKFNKALPPGAAFSAPAQSANPLAAVTDGNGPSPLDTAQYPSGPIGAPASPGVPMPPDGTVVDANAPSPLDTMPYPSGPVGAPGVADAVLPPAARPTGLLGNAPIRDGVSTAPQAAPNKQASMAAMLTNPWIDASVKTQVLAQMNPTMNYQKMDDGSIVALDPKGRTAPQVVYQGSGGKPTDDIREFEYAQKQGYTGNLEQWMQRKKATSGKYGLTPVYGTDKDGNPAIIQLGNEGAPIQAQLPEGFKISRDPIKVEGPTGTVILDPQTRQQVGFIPKDVAGAAKSKELGEAEGQALVNLPIAIATAENTLKTMDQLRNHPGKKNWGAFGVGAMLPDVPGTDTRGFGALVDQVKGQNFMTAFQSLKGAGAITEQEGAKAEKAQARLDRAQSEKDFDAALKDLEDVVRAGMERARAKAGVKTSGNELTNQSTPQETKTINGKTYFKQGESWFEK